MLALTAALSPAGFLSAQQQPPAQPAQQAPSATGPTTPHAPFQVPPAQQAWLDQVLAKWEQDSAAVTTFYCDFERDVPNMLGPATGDPYAKEKGKLGYTKPDKGSFQITEAAIWGAEQKAYQPPKDANDKEEPGEHWVCNGKSVYEYRRHDKKLVVTPIPPQMQGKEIVNGPLPFLFGAETAKLKLRYWLRPDPALCNDKFIGIHAKPKYQEDAANYSDVWVVLRNEAGQPLMPAGLRILHPDKSWHEYRFNLKTAQVNPVVAGWFAQLFDEPRTPWGWQRIEEPMRQAQQPQPPQR
jgi:TIGR03009 family protein